MGYLPDLLAREAPEYLQMTKAIDVGRMLQCDGKASSPIGKDISYFGCRP